MKKAMTRAEFIEYAHEVLSGEALECVYEQLAEFNGEVARFGDGGPGSAIGLQATIRSIKQIEATLARLEKREPRDFGFRMSLPR